MAGSPFRRGGAERGDCGKIAVRRSSFFCPRIIGISDRACATPRAGSPMSFNLRHLKYFIATAELGVVSQFEIRDG
jgi:hypothetical protein